MLSHASAKSSAFPPVLAYLRIACMFCALIGAGLVACVAQATSYALIRPLSCAAHRRVSVVFSRAFLLCGTVVLERWGRVRIVPHGDHEPFPPRTPTLCILNHCSSVDMLIGLAWLARYGPPFPGNAKAVVKASLGSVPIFGWILRFAEFPLISRSWENDRLLLTESFRSLLSHPVPLWYVIYPEGSRVDPQKLAASQDYARNHDLPILDHVLLPRVKAFAVAVRALRGKVDDICDATLMFEGPIPTAKTALAGECETVIHAYTKRHKFSDIPEDDAGIENWLIQRWKEKDLLITQFKRDPSSIGPARDEMFPLHNHRPSIFPFVALLVTSVFAVALTCYLSANNKFLLRLLYIGPPLALLVSAAIFYVNLIPSSKGLSKKNISSANTVKKAE